MRDTDLTLVSEFNDGELRGYQDCLAAEEPLQIRVDGRSLAVTMRTPGHDLELAAGFLLTEGLIAGRVNLESLRHGRTASGRQIENVVDVELSGGSAMPRRSRRRFLAVSSCGICGKSTIESLRVGGIRRPNLDFRLAAETLCALPEKLRAAQPVFGRTGGLHAAAAFDANGELLALREDVGRHNAVDKIAGWALLNSRLPLAECVLLVSGRGGFEIVQKALVAGLPILACVSAPSGLAVKLARELGLTLVGFLRGRRFVIYSEEQRILCGRPFGLPRAGGTACPTATR